jgi:hypothetical protein
VYGNLFFSIPFGLVVKFGSFCPTLVDPKLRITEFVSGLSQQTAIKRFFLNSGAGIW